MKGVEHFSVAQTNDAPLKSFSVWPNAKVRRSVPAGKTKGENAFGYSISQTACRLSHN
jgi:hypothetical protein